jgi:hypothetical protein
LVQPLGYILDLKISHGMPIACLGHANNANAHERNDLVNVSTRQHAIVDASVSLL